MKRPRHALVLLLFVALAAAACEPDAPPAPAPPDPGPAEKAVIKMAAGGEIEIRFFPDQAPGHVANFKKLARSGFYAGTTFHRVIPGFMIQGGDGLSKDDDPQNDGHGTPGYFIDAEFNEIPHRRGIVSMARRNDPNSAGSQFFIVVADNPHWREVLDGQYTVFGEVVRGMRVVDRIAEAKRDLNDRPFEDQVIESIAIEPLEPAADGAGKEE